MFNFQGVTLWQNVVRPDTLVPKHDLALQRTCICGLLVFKDTK